MKLPTAMQVAGFIMTFWLLGFIIYMELMSDTRN